MNSARIEHLIEAGIWLMLVVLIVMLILLGAKVHDLVKYAELNTQQNARIIQLLVEDRR